MPSLLAIAKRPGCSANRRRMADDIELEVAQARKAIALLRQIATATKVELRYLKEKARKLLAEMDGER